MFKIECRSFVVSYRGTYFAASWIGGSGAEDTGCLMRSITNRKIQAPQINSAFSDHHACLPTDEHFMICTSVECGRQTGRRRSVLFNKRC
jgi:hypothetical protein